MPKFYKALAAWLSDAFTQALKAEFESLKPSTLPFAQRKYINDDDLKITVLSVTDNERVIQVNVGVFYSEILAGCNCGDDPLSENAYCEMQISIDKSTAEAEFTLVED